MKLDVFSRGGGGFGLSALYTVQAVLVTGLMMASARAGDIHLSSLSIVLAVAFPVK